jgi:hypothetical protein
VRAHELLRMESQTGMQEKMLLDLTGRTHVKTSTHALI